MAYTFDPLFAADPNNPAMVAANAAITLFDPADVTQAAVTITDVTGAPLPNPVTVNKNGFGPAFQHATLDRLGWSGGGFTGYFTSFEGIKAAAVAAQNAAETAGNDAAAAASADLAAAVADAEAAQAAAATSATAAANSAALVNAPADTAVETLINGTGTATRAALNATYVPTADAKINDVGATAALMQNLDAAGSSCAIQVLGDSTGVSTTRWVYLMAQYLATKYPAFTVRHRFWNDATQLYDAPSTLQAGPGGNRHAQFVSGQNAWLYITNSAALNITADLDVSAQVALDDWTPATVQAIVGRFNSAGTRGWMLRVLTTGMLELQWSNDGTNTSAATSTVAPTVADGGTLWVRATLDVDNGASGRDIKFYTSADGVAWTQLGGTVTQATVTTVFNPAYRMELGARSNGSDYLYGKIYEVRVRNGINGPTIVPVSPELWEATTNAGGKITWGGAPVLDIINGSRSGANIYFLNDAVREPIMTPQYTTLLTFLSCSHNDSTRMGPQYLGDWDNLLATVKSRLPMSSVVVVGQNPRATPADVIPQHAARLAQLAGWSTRNGAKFINVYRAFMDYLAANPGATLTSLLDVLGIHPTDAAYSTIYWPAIRTMFERRA